MPQSRHQKRKHKNKPGSLFFNPNRKRELGCDLRKNIETCTPFLQEEAVKRTLPNEKWLEVHDSA